MVNDPKAKARGQYEGSDEPDEESFDGLHRLRSMFFVRAIWR
jgi:hypothetical protein